MGITIINQFVFDAIRENTSVSVHMSMCDGFVFREHDKNPELLFETLFKLQEEGYLFTVSVLGEGFTDVPGITFIPSKLKTDFLSLSGMR